MNRFLLLCLLAGTAIADDGDETLRGWLAKSELVVAGQFITEPIGITHETGVLNYVCDFKVAQVLKGNTALAGSTSSVNIVRLELDVKDKYPLIQKDAECILFLTNVSPDKPAWQTVDFWFGVQPASPWLARSLKRLAAEVPSFGVKCQRAEDKIAMAKEDKLIVLTVTSPRGIGSATISRQGPVWPSAVVLRFNLKGLESLRVETGHGEALTTSHHEKNVTRRPDNSFEFVVPRDRLGAEVKTLTVHWIDFYR
jgi:hypothetical protein